MRGLPSPIISSSIGAQIVTIDGLPNGSIGMAICSARGVGPAASRSGSRCRRLSKFPRRPSSWPAPPSLVPLSIVGALPGIGGPVDDEWLPLALVVIPGEPRR